MSVTAVHCQNIVKRYGANTILNNINLEVKDGEFLVLVGPSGCGKSTLLRMIAGLDSPTSGQIMIGDRDVTPVDPRDRDVAMVFQSYALYPHMSVYDNMAFGLKMRKVPADDIDRRVHEVAEMLQLDGYLQRKPKQLSGGQRQRVALGRAIARKARVFLFDEPLSNLDAQLRHQMRVEIKKLHHRLKNTMIYVTHDQVEATTMGDRIVVLNGGHVQQLAEPRQLYSDPSNRFVAGFIGAPEMNFVDGLMKEGRFWFGEQSLDFANTGDSAATLGIRPEAIELTEGGEITGNISLIENLGSHNLIHVQVQDFLLRVLLPHERDYRMNESVGLNFRREFVCWFDANGDRVG